MQRQREADYQTHNGAKQQLVGDLLSSVVQEKQLTIDLQTCAEAIMHTRKRARIQKLRFAPSSLGFLIYCCMPLPGF